jgi:hypothetical protein
VSSISDEQSIPELLWKYNNWCCWRGSWHTYMLYSHNIYNTKTISVLIALVRNTSTSAALLLLQCIMRRRYNLLTIVFNCYGFHNAFKYIAHIRRLLLLLLLPLLLSTLLLLLLLLLLLSLHYFPDGCTFFIISLIGMGLLNA